MWIELERSLPLGLRVVISVQLSESRSENKVRLEIVGSKPNRLLQRCCRIVRLPRGKKCESKQIIQPCRIWLQLQCRTKRFDRAVILLMIAEPHAQVSEGRRIRMSLNLRLHRRWPVARRRDRRIGENQGNRDPQAGLH